MRLTFDRSRLIRTSCAFTRKLRALSAVLVRLVKKCLFALKDSWRTNPWDFSSNKPSKNEDGAGSSPTLLTKQPPGQVGMFTNHRKQNSLMLG